MASRRLSTYGLAATLALGSLWLLSHSFSLGRDYSDLGQSHLPHVDLFNSDHAFDLAQPQSSSSPRRRNITFATSFVYHGDVYMALAKSIGDIMDSEDAPGQIHVFAQPFPYGFQEVVEDLHLWKHQGVRAEHDTFIDFLNSETGDGGVDLIVLGTCQYECVVPL